MSPRHQRIDAWLHDTEIDGLLDAITTSLPTQRHVADAAAAAAAESIEHPLDR